MKVTTNSPSEQTPAVLSIYCKVSDCFSASLVSGDGVTIGTQDDGYVPGFMPGNHYGDYIILDIELATGRVTNWRQPTSDELQQWVDSEDFNI